MGMTFNQQSDGAVVITVGVWSQYVMFVDEVWPHEVTINVQQTPKPSAHDPELVPDLSLHSALV
jgi:hypothetical protein